VRSSKTRDKYGTDRVTEHYAFMAQAYSQKKRVGASDVPNVRQLNNNT
jgi:hypothetical protein